MILTAGILASILEQVEDAFYVANLDANYCESVRITGITFFSSERAGKYITLGKKDNERDTQFEVLVDTLTG